MSLEWSKRMISSFGFPFLWLVVLIYFTQGFRSFVWTAVSYQMKDVLKLSPSVSQFLVSVAFFPWSIKPIYGIFSDCLPIRGKKRLPYLVMASILSLLSWLVLSLKSSVRSSRNLLTIFLTLQNFGSAMADVVIDAMIAEAVRSERAEYAGDLQSLSWFAMAFGGLFGSLLGGYTISNLRIDMIFLVFSVLPAIQLVSCAYVPEIHLGHQDLKSDNKKVENLNQDFIQSESKDYSNSTISRRRKNKKKPNKRNISSMKSEIVEGQQVPRTYFLSFKSALYSLCKSFTQPMILRPMAWFFFSNAAVPNISTIMFYYQTEILKMEATFLGTTRVVGWFGLLLGTYSYNKYLKKMQLRRILAFAHMGLAVVCLLDIALVSGLHGKLGIQDKYMVLFGSAFGDAINQFKFMPFLIISGKLCPAGIEGTLFALFMSINNLGSTLGSFLGAGLTSALNISSELFDNLIFALAVQLLATLFPIFLLFLIPKEANGLTS